MRGRESAVIGYVFIFGICECVSKITRWIDPFVPKGALWVAFWLLLVCSSASAAVVRHQYEMLDHFGSALFQCEAAKK